MLKPVAAEAKPPISKGRPARAFTDFVHARRTGRDPSRPPDDKLWARSVAERLGIALPELYGLFQQPGEVSLAALPERFVLKPAKLTDRRGVLLLERRDGRYFDRVSRAHLSAEQIIEQLEAVFEKFPRRPTTVIAEELIESDCAIPIDYKFFVFGTEIRIIEHINVNDGSKKVFFYDGEFNALPTEDKIKLNFQRIRRDQPRPPACRDAMLATVRGLAGHLATPFTRIDMYSARRGPVLGEITATPGGAYFGSSYRLTESYDAALGQEWARAAAALGQPIPRITGRAPIRRQASATVSIGVLALRDLKSDLKALEIEKQAAEARLRRLEARLSRMERSLSWRFTRPLRGLMRALSALGVRRPARPRQP